MTHAWRSQTKPLETSLDREVFVYDVASKALQGLGLPSARRSAPVRTYVCGITPYDSSHLGHAFTAVSFDVLRRTLEYSGYRTAFAQNITDVDDPLFAKARALNEDWRALAARQVETYRRSMAVLNVIPPDSFIAVSEVMPQIARDAAKLAELSGAYQIEGTTYFACTPSGDFLGSDPDLLDNLIETFAERGGDPHRPGKRHPLDPPLWVPSAPDEPSWPANGLGPGRPGWHLECVTIASESLGELPIDIQGGGADLAFPHHEMSRQEALVLYGCPLARYYMHTGMVRFEGEKMSKSLGNLVLVSELIDQGWDAMHIRLALLSSHYRAEMDWDPSLLDVASERYGRWRSAFADDDRQLGPDDSERLLSALANDLDTPGCLLVLDELCGASPADRRPGPASGSANSAAAFVRKVLGVVL